MTKGQLTVRIREINARELQYRSSMGGVHYCPRGLLGTVSETVAIRAVSGSTTLKAPGDWSNHNLAGCRDAFHAYCDREGLSD